MIQSSYLSQISQIIFVEKRLSCGVILGGKFWEFFWRFCHNLRAVMWRKIEPKKYICGEKMTNMRCGMISSIRVILRHRTQTMNSNFSHHKLALGQLTDMHNPHINHHSETSLREITQRHHSEISLRKITWLYGKGLSCSKRECVDDLGQVFNLSQTNLRRHQTQTTPM